MAQHSFALAVVTFQAADYELGLKPFFSSLVKLYQKATIFGLAFVMALTLLFDLTTTV